MQERGGAWPAEVLQWARRTAPVEQVDAMPRRWEGTWRCPRGPNGCDWDEETCSEAAEGHLEVLQWARQNGCLGREDVELCPSNCRPYLREHGCPGARMRFALSTNRTRATTGPQRSTRNREETMTKTNVR